MPITFRCSACSRTLSIARRKAGSQVNCPKCAALIHVPAAAGVAVASNPMAAAVPVPQAAALDALPLFERDDFEALLEPVAKSARAPKSAAMPPPIAGPVPIPAAVPKASPAPMAMPAPSVAEEAPAIVAVPVPTAVGASSLTTDDADLEVAELDGVIVNRQKLTWIAVAIAVLLAASFAVGYFLGRATVPKPVAISCGDRPAAAI
jgi:hypothetical protein